MHSTWSVLQKYFTSHNSHVLNLHCLQQLLASEAGRFRTMAATVTIDKAYFETLLRR
jgi:hypothetical protein